MRRTPAPQAVPYLIEARTGLKEFVKAHGQEAHALRLLSQAEECLLSYPAAIRYLQAAMSLSDQKDKKDLKRMASLKACETQWAELTLSPDQLAELGHHLRARLSETGCDHTLRHTEEWLRGAGVRQVNSVVVANRNQGGFCDCEVICNVVTD